MAFKRSDQQRGGRYLQGGTVELRGDKLGWWERKLFDRSPTDVSYTITSKYANRPDLLAFDLYGRANLQWFVMQYNNALDVYTDFNEGTTIVLPTRGRLFGELLSKST